MAGEQMSKHVIEARLAKEAERIDKKMIDMALEFEAKVEVYQPKYEDVTDNGSEWMSSYQ
jgi:hypothetical protein